MCFINAEVVVGKFHFARTMPTIIINPGSMNKRSIMRDLAIVQLVGRYSLSIFATLKKME